MVSSPSGQVGLQNFYKLSYNSALIGNTMTEKVAKRLRRSFGIRRPTGRQVVSEERPRICLANGGRPRMETCQIAIEMFGIGKGTSNYCRGRCRFRNQDTVSRM